jgi:hypothetical protein
MPKKRRLPEVNFPLRLPEGLRKRIEQEAATNNNSSLNKQIIEMLEYWFQPTILADEVFGLLDKLKVGTEKKIQSLEAEIAKLKGKGK